MTQESETPTIHEYSVVVFQEDDAWVAFVPTLDIATQGDNRDHAFAMAQEAIELWINVAVQRGEDIPVERGEAAIRQVAVTL